MARTKRLDSKRCPQAFKGCPIPPKGMYWSIRVTSGGSYYVALMRSRWFLWDRIVYGIYKDGIYYVARDVGAMLEDVTPGLLHCWETEAGRALEQYVYEIEAEE